MGITVRCILICDCESDSDGFVDIPFEKNNTLLTALLSACFPGATGMEHRPDPY